MRKQAQPVEADADQPRKGVSGRLETNGIGDVERSKIQGDLKIDRLTKPREGARSNPEIQLRRTGWHAIRGNSDSDQPVPEDEHSGQPGY
jgi:hypothetical protein